MTKEVGDTLMDMGTLPLIAARRTRRWLRTRGSTQRRAATRTSGLASATSPRSMERGDTGSALTPLPAGSAATGEVGCSGFIAEPDGNGYDRPPDGQYDEALKSLVRGLDQAEGR
jgi:hypothetical protein